ncbi:MAG TPA: ABC transporter permease [Bryobacteraceae bacterium]|nr:ABC transporter permease [Bryobacteraceae bacterium]
MPLWLETTLADLRYAVRGLLRAPVFALTALLAIAVGIGATTAVFSAVDRILFRPLPYANEQRLVSVGMLAPLDTNEFMFAVEYFDLRHDPGPFEEVTAFQAGALECDLSENNPLRMQCLRVESGFLKTLGVPLAAGREFTRQEDIQNGPRLAIISYQLWRSRFAGDPNVVGRTLPIDGAATTVVGVLPADFETPTLARADVLLPLGLNELSERQGRAFRVFGRLKPGVTLAQARLQLEPHFQRALLEAPAPFRKEISLRIRPVRDRQVGESRAASLILLGAVVALLLIACANVSNLLLARVLSRDREIAMRLALGATRTRLIRQTLTESALLGGLGCAAGCFLAWALLRLAIVLAPTALPLLDKANIDGRVLTFAVAASGLASLAFGIAPALRRPASGLLGGWHTAGLRRNWLRQSLIAGQIAVSLTLLAAAGLLLRSLWNLQNLPLGLQADHLITAHFTLGQLRYGKPEDQLAFFNAMEAKLAALPGFEAVAISDSLPPSGGTRSRLLAVIDVEGQPRMPEGTGGLVTWRFVTPAYFQAMGIRLLRGRNFTEQDRLPSAKTVILSESLARRLFPNEDPIGKHVLSGATVIGVTADTKNVNLTRSDPEYYLLRKPLIDATFQNAEPPLGWRSAWIVARTPLNPELALQTLRGAVREADPALPVQMATMRGRLVQLTERPRFNALLLAVFAGIGLFLAAIGFFGVISFLVTQRRREIGVRLALGATPARIFRQMTFETGRWVAAGVMAGLAGAFVCSRWLRSLLFQVEPNDPYALIGAVVLLCLVCICAMAGPVRRASTVDPMETLRQE